MSVLIEIEKKELFDIENNYTYIKWKELKEIKDIAKKFAIETENKRWVLLDLDSSNFDFIKNIAIQRQTSPKKLIANIITNWVSNNKLKSN